eukprot:g15049.t1
MPTFVCVRCFDCGLFQGIQKPKSKKFVCKICHQKQSIRKVYASSDAAKDIRELVMDRNRQQGEAQQEEQQEAWARLEQKDLEEDVS